jgi:hypothetical protein
MTLGGRAWRRCLGRLRQQIVILRPTHWRESSEGASVEDGENFEIVKRAIDEKRCLSGMYDDYYREFCPHVLGWKISTDYRKPSRRNVWMFQFGGESKRGLPEGGQWR